ncbi:MAG: hypothetical protein JXR58_04490 [Bacteroidales bacterium]|nr:hypothetical protein [Bacteroidales bacterium]
MDKQNILSPALIIALTVSFVVITFLLFLKPKNKKLISRKIKLGAAILSLSSFLNTGLSAQEPMCYSVPKTVKNSKIKIYENQFVGGQLFYQHKDTIKGRIYDFNKESEYNFSIVDENEKIQQSGKLIIRDTSIFVPIKKIEVGDYSITITETKNGSKSPVFILKQNITIIENKKFINNTCYF